MKENETAKAAARATILKIAEALARQAAAEDFAAELQAHRDAMAAAPLSPDTKPKRR